MRIALISFEFPPSVAIGGIGTYAWEAAKMLASSGCEVEVFTAGKEGREPAAEFGVRVHRFDVRNRSELRESIVPAFGQRHRERSFDVIESPEIGAEGAAVAAAFPEIAVVVKLHTPTYLVGEIGFEEPTLKERARFTLGALRRGHWATMSRTPYKADDDPECLFTRRADEIASPSRAIGERVGADWGLDHERVVYYPYPFEPENDFLKLSLPGSALTVGFLGRLEARKGVVEIAKAIPAILSQAPEMRFHFIGPSWPYRRGDMESWIRAKCRKHLDRIEFVGATSRNQLPSELARLDMILLPSRWENFPFACWEALASGRAVIGSSAGGMGDVIDAGVSGLLVPPQNPRAIADAVLSLAGDYVKVAGLSAAGRKRVCEHLRPARILPLQLASYHRAIKRAKQRNNFQ